MNFQDFSDLKKHTDPTILVLKIFFLQINPQKYYISNTIFLFNIFSDVLH